MKISKTVAWLLQAAGLCLLQFTHPLMAQTASPANVVAVIADQSVISFVSKQMGVPVEGKFGKFDAQLQFDPKQAGNAKISFSVDIASALIGDAETVKELRKPTWFDMAKFPKASFTSTSAKALGGGKFEVAGNLSIKGTSKAISTVVQLSQKAGVTTVEGTFPLKRLEFKLGEAEWKDVSIVADDVLVKIKLNLSGVAPL